MSNVTYTTLEGERFDTIAYKAYGDALLFLEIVEANPYVQLNGEPLPAGIILNIPVRERPVTEQTNLPPWKQ
jgi:phage tail protein X